MKKKRKQITIKFSNKWLYTFVAIIILAIVCVGVWALGAVPNPGHAISELQTCEEGQTLQVVDGEWSCVDVAISSYDTGWIQNSDWTDATFMAEHNFDAPTSQLLVQFLISPTGSDSDCFYVTGMNTELTSLSNRAVYGIRIAPYNNNRILVETGDNGISSIDSFGEQIVISNPNWYYKIKVWKLG